MRYFPTKKDEGCWVLKVFPPFAAKPPVKFPKSVYFIVDDRTGEVFENGLTEDEACNAYSHWLEGDAHDAKNLVVQDGRVIRTVEVK